MRRTVLVLALLATAACSSSDDAAAPVTEVASTTTAPATTGPTAASTTTAADPPTTVASSASAATVVEVPPGPIPTVEGPVTGGTFGVPANPMPDGLAAEYGYVEEEFFVSGTATAFAPTAALGADGVWPVAEAGRGDFRTRILVRRPADPAAFDGTVVVEWLNVSAGRDSDPDFGLLHPELLAHGSAWVGVSAQRSSLEGGGLLEIPGVPALALAPLKVWDPERYGSLRHPGDAFSYDVFSQVGRLVWARGAGNDPLGGLRPEHVVAVGESQSAFRLVTYVNAVHPNAGVFDGFLIHSRSGAGAPLADTPEANPPSGTRIRDDLDVPVLQFQTETDLVRLGFAAARQPDTTNVMTWEVAGTAHADQSTLDYGERVGPGLDDPGRAHDGGDRRRGPVRLGEHRSPGRRPAGRVRRPPHLGGRRHPPVGQPPARAHPRRQHRHRRRRHHPRGHPHPAGRRPRRRPVGPEHGRKRLLQPLRPDRAADRRAAGRPLPHAR